MPKTRSYHPGTWLLIILVKITTFLVTTGFVIVDHRHEVQQNKEPKSGGSHD